MQSDLKKKKKSLNQSFFFLLHLFIDSQIRCAQGKILYGHVVIVVTCNLCYGDTQEIRLPLRLPTGFSRKLSSYKAYCIILLGMLVTLFLQYSQLDDFLISGICFNRTPHLFSQKSKMKSGRKNNGYCLLGNTVLGPIVDIQ